MKRRQFLKGSLLPLLSPGWLLGKSTIDLTRVRENPIALSTWGHGMAANETAMELLGRGNSAVDAVEAGVRVSEADPKVGSVGYGGAPDADGNVTLDASIMDSKGNAGAVAFLQDFKHPISVARKVMDETDHVMLVGEGAKRFAREKGFVEENILTDSARKAWEKRKGKRRNSRSSIDQNDHDTISLLAQDEKGNLAGACTTSGLAYKLHGRVGDSPIIGAGLYVDNEIGAAGATGLGEEVIKTAGSFLVVELMRQGHSPEEACKLALERILNRHAEPPNFQVAYIALRIDGTVGAAALRKGFTYSLHTRGSNTLTEVVGLLD